MVQMADYEKLLEWEFRTIILHSHKRLVLHNLLRFTFCHSLHILNVKFKLVIFEFL